MKEAVPAAAASEADAQAEANTGKTSGESAAASAVEKVLYCNSSRCLTHLSVWGKRELAIVHIGLFESDQMVPVQDFVAAAAVPTTVATEVVEVQSCHQISWTDIKPALKRRRRQLSPRARP